MKENKKLPVSVALRPDQVERLDRYGKTTKRSRSKMIEHIIDTYFNFMFDQWGMNENENTSADSKAVRDGGSSDP